MVLVYILDITVRPSLMMYQSLVFITILPWLNMFSWLITSVEMTILVPRMKSSRALALL